MPEPTLTTSPAVPTRNASSLCRIYWMLIGNAALFVLLVVIVEKRIPFLTGIDAVYGAALASLILVRYVDIRYLGGGMADCDSKPATLSHWRRYAAALTGIAAAAWVAAHTAAQMLR